MESRQNSGRLDGGNLARGKSRDLGAFRLKELPGGKPRPVSGILIIGGRCPRAEGDSRIRRDRVKSLLTIGGGATGRASGSEISTCEPG